MTTNEALRIAKELIPETFTLKRIEDIHYKEIENDQLRKGLEKLAANEYNDGYEIIRDGYYEKIQERLMRMYKMTHYTPKPYEIERAENIRKLIDYVRKNIEVNDICRQDINNDLRELQKELLTHDFMLAVTKYSWNEAIEVFKGNLDKNVKMTNVITSCSDIAEFYENLEIIMKIKESE